MFRKLAASLVALSLAATPALAGSGTIAVTPGSGATYEVITQGGGNFVGMFGLCDGTAAAQCVAVKAASTAAGATDPALVVAISPNNTVAATQSGTWTVQPGNTANTTPWLITGSGTAGAAAAGVFTVQGIASMTPFLVNPGTAANWGVVAQASTTSGQVGQLGLGAVTTAAPTYTTAQSDPLSLDTSGNLRVNCTTGCSAASSITGWAGGTLGAMANYGTSPGAVLAPGVNAFVTNTNANGSAVSASSSPVVIASDQAAVAVKAASGAFASGSIASGALASGSIASGAAVSGAFVAGSITDLAHGQGAMAASVPVAIASNQSSIPVAATLAAGSANAGGVEVFDAAGTNKLNVVAASTAPVTATNTAAVVDLRPDSPGIIALGATTASASVPVALATDKVLGTPSSAMTTGSYCMSQISGTMAAGLAAAAPIASFRYGGAGIALIRKVDITATDFTTGFTAGNTVFQLFAARSFTVSDSTGNAATLTGNNGKLRTSFSTTAISDFRVSATATLTAGTRTLDTTPLGIWVSAIGTTAETSITGLTPVELIRQNIGEQPIQLATNEGWIVEATVPATGTWTFAVKTCWDEVSAY